MWFFCLNSDINFLSGSYTPQFTWQSGAQPPTVENVLMYYYKFGRVAIVGGRFRITAIGSPTDQEYLQISLPPGINGVSGTAMPVAQYLSSDGSDSMLVRTAGNMLQVIANIGGDYSGDKIKTGYQGFEAVFMTA